MAKTTKDTAKEWIEGVSDLSKELMEDSKEHRKEANEHKKQANELKQIEEGIKETLNLAKGGSIPFGTSNLYFEGFGRDRNGNSIVKVSFPNSRAFSIQTNANLPTTHSVVIRYKLKEVPQDTLKEMEKEINDYVKEFGSPTQMKKLKTYAKGGEVIPVATISNFRKNIMGTLSFDLKVKGMRKAQDFIVYPIKGDTDRITIQSDKKFGYIYIPSKMGVLSKSGSYSYNLQSDMMRKTAIRFTLSDSDYDTLIEKIKETSGTNVGRSFVKSDNTGASLLANGGDIMEDLATKIRGLDFAEMGLQKRGYDVEKSEKLIERIKEYVLGEIRDDDWYSEEKLEEYFNFLKVEDVGKMQRYVSDKLIMAFYCGVRSVYDFKGDYEMSALQGIFTYDTKGDYIEKNIARAIYNCENSQIELGLKYPQYDFKKLLGKPKRIEYVKRKSNFGSGREYEYTYKVWGFDDLACGKAIGYQVYDENGKKEGDYVNSAIREGNPTGDPEKVPMQGGYLGLISSDYTMIEEVLKFMSKQTMKSGAYVKDVDVLYNGLGGVGERELKETDIEYAKGGVITIGNSSHYTQEEENKKAFDLLNEKLISDKSNPLYNEFQEEKLYLDDTNGFVSIVGSVYDDYEPSDKKIKEFKEYLKGFLSMDSNIYIKDKIIDYNNYLKYESMDSYDEDDYDEYIEGEYDDYAKGGSIYKIKPIKYADGKKYKFNKQGIVKEVRELDGKLLKEITFRGKKYRRNSTYKTYNSVKGNELLTDSDFRGYYAKGGYINLLDITKVNEDDLETIYVGGRYYDGKEFYEDEETTDLKEVIREWRDMFIYENYMEDEDGNLITDRLVDEYDIYLIYKNGDKKIIDSNTAHTFADNSGFAKGGKVKQAKKGKWLSGKQWHIYYDNGWQLERYRGDNLLEVFSINIEPSGQMDEDNEEIDFIRYSPSYSGDIKIPENVQYKVISILEEHNPKYYFGDEYDNQIKENEYSEMYAKGGKIVATLGEADDTIIFGYPLLTEKEKKKLGLGKNKNVVMVEVQTDTNQFIVSEFDKSDKDFIDNDDKAFPISKLPSRFKNAMSKKDYAKGGNVEKLTKLETDLLTKIVEELYEDDFMTDFVLGNVSWAKKLTNQQKGVLSSLVKKGLVEEPYYEEANFGERTAQIFPTELGKSLIRKSYAKGGKTENMYYVVWNSTDGGKWWGEVPATSEKEAKRKLIKQGDVDRIISVRKMDEDEYGTGGKISIDKYHQMRNKEYAKEVKAGRIKDTDENFDNFDEEYFDELQERGYTIEMGTGGFLLGNMLGGYLGYKLGKSMEQDDDVFGTEREFGKKVAKSVKKGIEDYQKKEQPN